MEPLSLTNHLLGSNGFMFNMQGWYIRHAALDHYIVVPFDADNSVLIYDRFFQNCMRIAVGIKTADQLQKLYLGLCGKELILNQPEDKPLKQSGYYDHLDK